MAVTVGRDRIADVQRYRFDVDEFTRMGEAGISRWTTSRRVTPDARRAGINGCHGRGARRPRPEGYARRRRGAVRQVRQAVSGTPSPR